MKSQWTDEPGQTRAKLFSYPSNIALTYHSQLYPTASGLNFLTRDFAMAYLPSTGSLQVNFSSGSLDNMLQGIIDQLGGGDGVRNLLVVRAVGCQRQVLWIPFIIILHSTLFHCSWPSRPSTTPSTRMAPSTTWTSSMRLGHGSTQQVGGSTAVFVNCTILGLTHSAGPWQLFWPCFDSLPAFKARTAGPSMVTLSGTSSGPR